MQAGGVGPHAARKLRRPRLPLRPCGPEPVFWESCSQPRVGGAPTALEAHGPRRSQPRPPITVGLTQALNAKPHGTRTPPAPHPHPPGKPQVSQPLVPLVDEFAARLFGELDYMQEGRNAERFQAGRRAALPLRLACFSRRRAFLDCCMLRAPWSRGPMGPTACGADSCEGWRGLLCARRRRAGGIEPPWWTPSPSHPPTRPQRRRRSCTARCRASARRASSGAPRRAAC